jgi:hypothetical protein
MFCCEGFRNLASLAGQRGLAILVRENFEGKMIFVFQSRGIAFDDVAKWKAVPIDIMINVDAVVGLRFCPFCGRKVEQLVQESPEFFRDLMLEHKKFLASTPGL